jgi:hypothetical protein
MPTQEHIAGASWVTSRATPPEVTTPLTSKDSGPSRGIKSPIPPSATAVATAVMAYADPERRGLRGRITVAVWSTKAPSAASDTGSQVKGEVGSGRRLLAAHRRRGAAAEADRAASIGWEGQEAL